MSVPSADLTLRHLARVVESADDAIVSKDLDGTITSWNPAAVRMFGYTEDEAVGRSIRMLVPAELQKEEDDVLSKLRAGQSINHYQTVRHRKDGTPIHISLTISPIRNEAGEIIGASKIARDITEQVRLRAIVDEQTANTEKLSEIGAVVASTLDRDRIIQKVTDTATAVTRAELGAFFYKVRDPQSGEAVLLHRLSSGLGDGSQGFPHQGEAPRTPALHGDGPVRLDDVTQHPQFITDPPSLGLPQGHSPVRSYLAVPVKGLSGEVLGGMCFGHSKRGVFTEQHERLAVGIASWASVALENARLYIEARDANRMKDEFLAVLSHELRTPLNAIVGYAWLLRGGILSGDKLARGLETLERNANLLTQIVEDVLDVSRIVTGKIRLDLQPVDLRLIIDNSVATVHPAADAKGVRIQTFVDPAVGPVVGDPDRLQQVVWNLLTNAVKFTGRNGQVQVRLERVNSHVEIVVRDTGAGIRPEFLPHVFERFRQAETGTTRRTGGLGLGLSIVRHIVEMHGGTVEVTSPGEGHGATFRVMMPIAAVQPERLAPRPEPLPRAPRGDVMASLSDLAGVRVLAVDDEHDALTLLRVVLEAAGAEVTTVSSPLQAVGRIEAVRPHVLVIDLGMPEMDGFELIRRIRTSVAAHVRDVPAAALTAFARSEDRTRALRSGFEMHLAKPVDPRELVASVATLVRRAGGGASIGTSDREEGIRNSG